MEPRTLLSAVSWTGTVSSDWDTAANWSDDAVPGPSDDVTINNAAHVPVTHSQNVTDAINSLTASQPLTISGGSLSVATASSTTSSLSVTGGTLTGAGAITVGGLLTLSSGTISGSGAVSANGGILLNQSNASFTLDGRTLTNPAGQTATWNGFNSAIVLSDGAVIDNLGTFQDEDTAAHDVQPGAGAAGSFNDAGSFIKSGSSSEGDFLQGVSFNVTGGTVDVQTGTLGLSGGGTDTSATFTSETGATLNFGGTHTLDSASSVGGAGTVGFVAPGDTIAMAATYDVTGTTIDRSGAGTVNFTGTIASIGATLMSQSGTLNFGTNAIDPTALTITGGTLTSTAAMTVSGLATLSGGTISGSGAVSANGGILFSLANANFTLDGRTLTNPAGQTATWSGFNSAIVLSDGAVIDNLGTFQDESTAAHDVQNGAGAAGTFNDVGSFIKSGSSSEGDIILGVSFNVTGGTVDVQMGTLGLFGGGTDSSATFTSETGATLNFGGTHTLDSASTVGGAGTVGFVASGTIAMAATYDVTGTTIDRSGNGTVNFTGTITSIGATLMSQSGTLNFGTNAIDPTALTITGGTLTSTAAMTVSGLATLSGGTISGSGAVSANDGILLNPTNASFTLDGRTLTNPAGQTATWSGFNSAIVLSDGAVIDNLGTFQDECTAKPHDVQNARGARQGRSTMGASSSWAAAAKGTSNWGVVQRDWRNGGRADGDARPVRRWHRQQGDVQHPRREPRSISPGRTRWISAPATWAAEGPWAL